MGYAKLDTFVKLPDHLREWFAVFRVSVDAEPEIVGYVNDNPIDDLTLTRDEVEALRTAGKPQDNE